MIKFEVGETYRADDNNYKILRRTEKSIVVQDCTGRAYRRFIIKSGSQILDAETVIVDIDSVLMAINKVK